MFNIHKVFNWMKQEADDYRSGEFSTATELAERAADHFRKWEVLDDPDHWIWDTAAHVMDIYEEEI